MNVYEVFDTGASIALYTSESSAKARLCTLPSTAEVKDKELKGCVRICVLTKECECVSVIVGVWSEGNVEKKMSEYFAKRFDEEFAQSDDEDYPEIKDKDEYVRTMTGRLLTKQSATDVNRCETYFGLTIHNVEL